MIKNIEKQLKYIETVNFIAEHTKVQVVEFKNSVLDDVLVSVCIQTYQHHRFIKHCLEGVLLQKTDFPFEILLGEDDSGDGTREICKKYAEKFPKLIKLYLHSRDNNISIGGKPSGRFNFLFNLTKAKGKYIALCEGDDYWTDPYKLQKQVDLLEKNQQCSMCFHSAFVLNEKEKNELSINNLTRPNKLEKLQASKGDFFFEGGSGAPTASIMFRSRFLKNIPEFYYKAPVGDMPMKLILSYLGDIIYLNEPMSVRRMGVSGSWNDITYSNLQKEKDYLIGMIEMLFAYDLYSERKNSSLVQEKIESYKKQLEYTELRILVKKFGNKKFLVFYKEELKNVLKDKSILKKVSFLRKFLRKLLTEKIKRYHNL